MDERKVDSLRHIATARSRISTSRKLRSGSRPPRTARQLAVKLKSDSISIKGEKYRLDRISCGRRFTPPELRRENISYTEESSPDGLICLTIILRIVRRSKAV